MKTSFFAVTLFLSALIMTAQATPVQLEARKSYSGEATYYEVDNGSCGGDYDDSDMVVALSEDWMGSGSDSSYCGKKLKVNSSKGSVTVKVVDTCASCDKTHIDLSSAAFKKLGKLDDGVLKVTWAFS
jgi:expansin (peptidoglycan-binding protein)